MAINMKRVCCESRPKAKCIKAAFPLPKNHIVKNMPEVPVQFSPLQRSLLEQYRLLHGFETIEQAAGHAVRKSLAALLATPPSLIKILVGGRKQ